MLSTSRLLVRPFSLADVPKVFVMSGEGGMRRWIDGYPRAILVYRHGGSERLPATV